MALPDRKARSPDRKALAKAIEDLLLASGAELDAETRETPARVAKAFSEDLLDGYERDPIETLKSSLVPAPRRGALVAGASRGIGRAVAEALIAEGIQVAVCALRAAPEVPGAAFAKRCDVSDEVEVRALFAEAGRCDCVVLNAGVLERAPIEDFTAAQWDRVLGVNLRGAFLCAREAFRTGATRIVGIGSVSGTLGTAQAAVQARDAGDVQKVLAFSRARKIPIVPRGAGSGKSGGALAEQGGIVLSLEKLDRIVEVSRADMVCVVEPGVILEKLQAAVEAEGLFYPPDPNSQARCSI